MKLEHMLYIVVMIAIVVFLVSTIYSMFHEKPEQKITFNVVGITDPKNATTLVQIQFECIKYCSIHEDYPGSCWKECEKLGKCYEENK